MPLGAARFGLSGADLGKLELIDTQTISGTVAQVDFTSIKESTYNVHLLMLSNMLTETDEEKRLSKIGLIVRINDKIQRLINLVVRNNRQAQNEPTIDAFKDLACYGIIAQIVEAGKWGK